jgi:hypothetical protein
MKNKKGVGRGTWRAQAGSGTQAESPKAPRDPLRRSNQALERRPEGPRRHCQEARGTLARCLCKSNRIKASHRSGSGGLDRQSGRGTAEQRFPQNRRTRVWSARVPNQDAWDAQLAILTAPLLQRRAAARTSRATSTVQGVLNDA